MDTLRQKMGQRDFPLSCTKDTCMIGVKGHTVHLRRPAIPSHWVTQTPYRVFPLSLLDQLE